MLWEAVRLTSAVEDSFRCSERRGFTPGHSLAGVSDEENEKMVVESIGVSNRKTLKVTEGSQVECCRFRRQVKAVKASLR